MDHNNHKTKHSNREATCTAFGKKGKLQREVQDKKAWEYEHVNLKTPQHVNVDVKCIQSGISSTFKRHL